MSRRHALGQHFLRAIAGNLVVRDLGHQPIARAIETGERMTQ